jgi:sugar lactone lactonase YvrE
MRNRTLNVVLPLVGLVLAAVCWCGAAESKSGAKSVVASGAKAVKLPGKFKFTEGPAVDAKGNVFFTDIPNNLIYKWSLDGKMSVWFEKSQAANGLFFDPKGNLLACQGGAGRVASISPKGKVTVLADKYEGKRFNKPNDLWIDPAGGVYFTDPVYGRAKIHQGGQHVYYLSPDGKKVTRVIKDLKKPNGIVGTPDGKILYVADHGAGKVYRYEITKMSLPSVTTNSLPGAGITVIKVLSEPRPKGYPPYIISRRPVQLKQLRKIVEDSRKKDPDCHGVMIRGDRNALYGHVLDAIGECRAAGVSLARIECLERELEYTVLSKKKLFAPVACDGMTLDSEGNVYLTESAVLVYNSKGKRIEQIDVPMRPTNVCFGGADMKTLIVTGRGAVCSIKMRVKGVRIP